AGADLVIGNRMQQTSQPARLTRVAARSDANGRFSLTHAPLEDYVMARKGGYVASASHPVQQLGSVEVVLVLGPASGSIAGRVVDQDGAGLPGIAVAVQDHDEALRRAPDGSLVGPRLPVVVRTDANGGFVADGLAAGKHTCQVRRLPDAPADAVATVVPGERQYVTLVVRRRAAVFGFVRGRDEQPRPGLYVMLTHADRSSQTAISAGDGSFRFEGVDDEPFELVAMRLATRRQVKRAFDGRTGLQMRVDLVIDDPPPLRVRAVTSSGRSLVGWRVSVDVAGARRDADVRDSGSAIFWTLPDGAHPISLRRAGAPHDAPPIATASGGPGDDVTVTVPATAAPGAAIRGRLVDDLGRPWQQAWAWLSAGPPVAEPSVAPDGSFAFGELGSGRHELRFGAVGAVKSRREVSLGAGEQHDLGDVVLPRGATLRVRFRRPDGSAWRGRPPMPWLKRADGTFLTTSNLDYAIDGDEVVVTCIPAGTYVVQRPMGDELVIAPAEVSLSAGVTRHLAFDVRLGRRCWLRFDAGGDDSELAVTVRTDQGDPVLTERVSAPEEGRYSVRALLPVGRVVIEARSEAGRRYRREYDVTAAQQAHVDVMVPGLR
ncbi:MAG: carboxypeptidase regulatory-like domain-containing protein, partial [Planctomycetes bacterium]|nr:carboxypeptidase regulatory-like domain-containing protein [Planctomycetota bacterium]